MPEIPNVLTDEENTILEPGQGKVPYSLTHDEYHEVLAHPNLFPPGKLGYKVDLGIKLTLTKCFNQRLLNYNQKFSRC